MAKVIAVDYGRKYIGLAVADDISVATILPPLSITSGQTPIQAMIKFMNSIGNVDLLLIGIPSGFGGKPTQMSQEIEAFAKLVREACPVQVKFWDETLTSKQAEKHKVAKKSQSSHSQAARIILQEYLDTHEYSTY
jgi:putative Holliday junction resolvase